MPADSFHSTEPSGVETVPGVTADFPIIAMGHGLVEVGDAMHEGLPALWFGDRNGVPAPFGELHVINAHAKDRETLVLFTFANIQGLEAIEMALARVRLMLTKDAK